MGYAALFLLVIQETKEKDLSSIDLGKNSDLIELLTNKKREDDRFSIKIVIIIIIFLISILIILNLAHVN